MKSIRILLLIGLLLVTVTGTVSAAEQKTMQKEYTFESETAAFAYPAKKQLEEQGTTYILKDITYKVLKETDTYVSRKATYQGLSEKQVPLKRIYRINGKDVALRADAEDVQYSEDKETWTETLTGRTSMPQFAQTRTISVDGQTYEATLMGTRQEDASKPYTARVRFTGDPDADFYLEAEKTRKKLTLKQENQEMGPAWNGYQKDIAEYLGLPAGSTVGTGRWDGGWQEENGRSVRYATFTGTRPAANYTATYQYTTYNAVVTYQNGAEPGDKKYEVKAICRYEVQKTPLWKVLAGIGAGILAAAACVIAIIYALQRRKREGEERH